MRSICISLLKICCSKDDFAQQTLKWKVQNLQVHMYLVQSNGVKRLESPDTVMLAFL